LEDYTVTISPLDFVVSDPVLEKHRLFPRGDVFSAAAVIRSPEPILVTILACPIANATENPLPM
jgi:hypothetical protein